MTNVLILALAASVGAMSAFSSAQPEERSAVNHLPAPNRVQDKPQLQAGDKAKELPSGAVRRFGSLKWQFANYVTPAAYSADGKWLVAWDGNVGTGYVRLLDPATGKEIRSFQSQSGEIHTLALARNRTIALSSFDRIEIWDAAAGKILRSFEGFIENSPCISADGRILAGVGGVPAPPNQFWDHPFPPQRQRKQLGGCVWDAATGEQLKPFAAGIKPAVSLDLALDGKTLAWREMSGDLHVVNVADGKERFQIKASAVKEPCLPPALAFSPDGKSLAYVTNEGLILVDTATGKKETRFHRKQSVKTDKLWKIAFAPAADILITCSDEPDKHSSSYGVWDVAKGEEKLRFSVPGRIVRPDNEAELFKGQDRTRMLSVPWWLTVSPVAADGKTIAFGNGQFVRFLDTVIGKWKKEPDQLEPIYAGAISRDGKTAVTASADGSKLRLWDAPKGTVRHTIELSVDIVRGRFAFSPDGTTLIGATNKPLFWDVQTGKEKIRELPEGSNNWKTASCIALSADGNMVAAGHGGGVISLWDLRSGKLSQLKECKAMALSLAFSGDGKRLVAGTGNHFEDGKTKPDGAVYLWDLTTRTIVRRFEAHKPNINTAAIMHDGRLVCRDVDTVAISPDGKLVCCYAAIWEADSGKELLSLSLQQLHQVTKVAFSPDGKTVAIAIGGTYGTPARTEIRLFDVKTMKEYRVLNGHWNEITSLTFTADSQTLFSTSRDGTALVWNIATPER